MFQEPAMQPARLLLRQEHPAFLPHSRLWQGIPSFERSPGGRCFCVFYSGGTGEQSGNFAVLALGGEDGAAFRDPYLVVQHPDAQVRVFDPNVWLDPAGRLWLTWAQSLGMFDGRAGVWAAVCGDPDAGEPVFSPPRRIANGVMMNKPTFTSRGEWLLPCAVWNYRGVKPGQAHDELAAERVSGVYRSCDGGATFRFIGGADVDNRSFDEHMIVERRDGSLWMLVRRRDGIGQAVSRDGGVTWRQEGRAVLPGPDARFFIRRLSSGSLLLVNHINFTGRNNLCAQLSFDDGATWQGALMLDARPQVSYPDGSQDERGRIRIVYDRERHGAREILMASFTERDVLAGACVEPGSRLADLVSRCTGRPSA